MTILYDYTSIYMTILYDYMTILVFVVILVKFFKTSFIVLNKSAFGTTIFSSYSVLMHCKLTFYSPEWFVLLFYMRVDLNLHLSCVGLKWSVKEN